MLLLLFVKIVSDLVLLVLIVPLTSLDSSSLDTLISLGILLLVSVQFWLLHNSYVNSYLTSILFKLVNIILNCSILPACKCNILSFDWPLFVVILNDKSLTFILAIFFLS